MGLFLKGINPVFPFPKQSPKYLDLSYKTDLTNLKTELHKTNLDVWGHSRNGKALSYKKRNMVLSFKKEKHEERELRVSLRHTGRPILRDIDTDSEKACPIICIFLPDGEKPDRTSNGVSLIHSQLQGPVVQN